MQIQISTEKFSWSPESREFVSEASDLGDTFGRVRTEFDLVSARTDVAVRVGLIGERWTTGEDRELVAWTYKPVDVHLHDFTVTIFND
jgi:hypothetical protein